MITPRIRTTVSIASFAVVLAAALALGGCAQGRSPVTTGWPSATPEARLVIRFDNVAQTYVDVYLVGEQRQWRLGRIEPGAAATLQIPEAALTTSSGFLRLAVLEGSPLSMEVARDPRAIFAIAQPASALMQQRWTFWRQQSATPQILSAPANASRP